MPLKFTPEVVAAAIAGFESQKRQIDHQIAELRAMLPGSSYGSATTPGVPTRKRKRFSAAARKRMREAQRLRWQRIGGEAESAAPATAKPQKPKRRISEEGMKRIIAATKRRWRLQKAATAKGSGQESSTSPNRNCRKQSSVEDRAGNEESFDQEGRSQEDGTSIAHDGSSDPIDFHPSAWRAPAKDKQQEERPEGSHSASTKARSQRKSRSFSTARHFSYFDLANFGIKLR